MSQQTRRFTAVSSAAVREVNVDRDMCMGAGECTFHAPRTFALGADGKSHVTAVDLDSLDQIVRAAQCCPNFAISVVEDGRRRA